MALSGALGRAGTPPERLDVSAEVTFDKLDAGWRVVSSALTVRGVVPGMSAADFVAAAEIVQRWLSHQPGADRQRRAERRGDARGLNRLGRGRRRRTKSRHMHLRGAFVTTACVDGRLSRSVQIGLGARGCQILHQTCV